MSIDLTTQIGKLELRNPVMTASGTFGYGDEIAEMFDYRRIGGIVTKSISMEPIEGNSPPRIVETAAGMLNAIGWANPGVDGFIHDKLPHIKNYPTKLIVSIAGNQISDFVNVVKRLDNEDGIDAYEIDISCPNVKEGLTFSSDPGIAEKTLSAVRNVTEKPVIAKLSPNVTDIVPIAKAVVDAGVDAISLINSLVAMSVDIRSRKPGLSSTFGGLSGPAIKPIALAKVYQVIMTVEIPVIGIGGITTAEDALEFLIVGARAIQVGTASFVDPLACIKVVEGIQKFCNKEKLELIAELTGSLIDPNISNS